MHFSTNFILKNLGIIFLIQLLIPTTKTTVFLRCKMYLETEGKTFDLYFENHVEVSFDRKNLFIYSYSNTYHTNFLIKDGNIGVSFKKKGHKMLKNFNNDIKGFGIRSLHENDIMYKLTNVTMDLTHISEKRVTTACDDIPLLVNEFEKGVHTLPLEQNFDFGVESVMYKLYHQKYPSLMKNEAFNEKSFDKTFQISFNSLADFVLSSLASQLTKEKPGIVKGLPEIKGEDYLIYNTTFSDVQTFKRVGDINITNSGLHFMAEAVYELSVAKIYGVFETGSYLNIKGYTEINLGGVRCNLSASINYNIQPCVIELTKVDILILGVPSFSFSGISGFDEWILGFRESHVREEIFDQVKYSIPQRIAQKVNEFISTNIICENFRP